MCTATLYSHTTLVKSISAIHFQRKRTLEFSVILSTHGEIVGENSGAVYYRGGYFMSEGMQVLQ